MAQEFILYLCIDNNGFVNYPFSFLCAEEDWSLLGGQTFPSKVQGVETGYWSGRGVAVSAPCYVGEATGWS